MVNISEFDMRRHIVLVTGAAGLLGEQHCTALLEVGAMVVATDISKFALNELRDGPISDMTNKGIRFEPLDVSDLGQVQELANRLQQENMMPTTLVNNAAVNSKVSRSGLLESGRLEEFDEEKFLNELSVGLTGAVNCCQVFGEFMAKNNFGNIVNIASDLAVIAPNQSIYRSDSGDGNISCDRKKPISYSIIKHGLLGLTKYMATYYCDRNVRCNALSPGGVKTDQPNEFINKLETLVPLGRMARPSEYKGAIKFLCSDASAYMNGQNIIIDGGRSVW